MKNEKKKYIKYSSWSGWFTRSTYIPIVEGLFLVERHPLPCFQPDQPIPIDPATRGHTLSYLLIFTSLIESFPLPQSIRDYFPGPPPLIIISLSPTYIPSLHMREVRIFQIKTLTYTISYHKTLKYLIWYFFFNKKALSACHFIFLIPNHFPVQF